MYYLEALVLSHYYDSLFSPFVVSAAVPPSTELVENNLAVSADDDCILLSHQMFYPFSAWYKRYHSHQLGCAGT